MAAADDLRSRQAIVTICAEEKGFNQVNSGNVSCRSAGGILITPTGANTANLSAERIVQLDGSGTVMGTGIRSSEWHMHLAILDAFPLVNAVVHTHADACVALACLRRDIPAFHYMIASFGGTSVRCAAYATFGTAALAAATVEALRDRTACLLANHGMVAIGKTLEAAFNATVKLETLARQYLLRPRRRPTGVLPTKSVRVGALCYGNTALDFCRDDGGRLPVNAWIGSPHAERSELNKVGGRTGE